MDERCAYCGASQNLTRDHVVPASRLRDLRERGVWLPSVKVIACAPCNSLKGDMWPWEWHEFRATGVLPPFRQSVRGGWSQEAARRRLVRQRPGCQTCGARGPRHFTRCTSFEAKRNDAWGVPAMA